MANTKKFLWLDVDGQLHEQTASETISVANGVDAGHAVNKSQLDGAVNSLTDLVNAEAARATQAEAALGDSLTTETANRVAADAAINAALTAETNARTAADTALGGRIDAEEAARIAADSAEASARAAADTALRNDLDAEIARATAAESAEATARTNADAALQAAIDALSSSSNTALTNAINQLNADLDAEEAARIAADAAIQASLDAEIARATAAEAAESAARIAADNTLTADLASEISRAEAAEGVLTAAVAAEASRAQAAEQGLADDIAAEQSRAQSAEGTITTALNAEIARAQAAEGVLTADLAAEISRATSTEAANLAEAKAYADARLEGLSWKASVDRSYSRQQWDAENNAVFLPAYGAAFVAQEGLANGTRILITEADQTAHADLGIYVVVNGDFVRAPDMAAGKDAAGAVVYVETGGVGTSYVCANAGTAIVGTDDLQFVVHNRAENISFGGGLQKSGLQASINLAEAQPVYLDMQGKLSFRADTTDFEIVEGNGLFKMAGALVGGPFASADQKHTHQAVAVVIASAETMGVAVKSDGSAATYDSSYVRGVVDNTDSGNARVVTSGRCNTAVGALSSFVADEIVYLGSAAGVFCKYADIPSGKWAVPVGFCIDGNSLTVHRMPAAMKA